MDFLSGITGRDLFLSMTGTSTSTYNRRLPSYTAIRPRGLADPTRSFRCGSMLTPILAPVGRPIAHNSRYSVFNLYQCVSVIKSPRHWHGIGGLVRPGHNPASNLQTRRANIVHFYLYKLQFHAHISRFSSTKPPGPLGPPIPDQYDAEQAQELHAPFSSKQSGWTVIFPRHLWSCGVRADGPKVPPKPHNLHHRSG